MNPEQGPPDRRRGVRTFVRRQGRLSKSRRLALSDHWRRFGLSLDQGPVDPALLFPANPAGRLILEIGFGMGDSLFDQARQHPECNFIGVEVHGPGVAHLVGLAASAGLANLRLYRDDAPRVLTQCLPPQCLDRVQIYFPDPWPKRRHHKRRLIDADFLGLLAGRLLPGRGEVHLATDWAAYAEQIEQVFDEDGRFERLAAQPERLVTKYEARALRLGHQVRDFIYRLR